MKAKDEGINPDGKKKGDEHDSEYTLYHSWYAQNAQMNHTMWEDSC